MNPHRVGRELIESAPRAGARRAGGVPTLFASTAVHAGLIALAVWSTVGSRADWRRGAADRVITVDRAAFRPRAERRPTSSSPRRPRGFQILIAPVDIPIRIPDINVAGPLTIAADFSGRGMMGGSADGVSATPLAFASFNPRDPIDGGDVDQPPYLLPDQMGPAYPDALRDRAPDGVVVVRFVVDTLGRVEVPSLKVLLATNPLFAASVRSALDHLLFLPAVFSGQRVRVRMEQRFEFHLAGR